LWENLMKCCVSPRSTSGAVPPGSSKLANLKLEARGILAARRCEVDWGMHHDRLETEGHGLATVPRGEGDADELRTAGDRVQERPPCRLSRASPRCLIETAECAVVCQPKGFHSSGRLPSAGDRVPPSRILQAIFIRPREHWPMRTSSCIF